MTVKDLLKKETGSFNDSSPSSRVFPSDDSFQKRAGNLFKEPGDCGS